MKIKSVAMLTLAAIAIPLMAMPTKQELKKVEGLVQELMRPELDEFKAGKKTRADVAQAAIALAEKAESDAAKMLLLKGSFTLYVGHGAFAEAVDVLKTLKATIPDIPPENMANTIESSLRGVPKDRGERLYRLLDDIKTYIRHQDELKAAITKSKRRPRLRELHVAIAEHYAYFGDWPKALDEFAKGDNPKAAEAAKAEKGEGKMPKSAIADFWWSYPVNDDENLQKAFKRHAAAVYADAIASGDISGLVKVKAQRRIDEVKGYGEDMLAGVITSPDSDPPSHSPAGKLYCVVDLSAGPNAAKYPVSYLAAEPKGGWTDEYKTTKLILRRIEPGTFIMGADQKDESHRITLTKPFYIGVFEVTQKQYELVTGNNPSKYRGDMRPVETVSYKIIRGSMEGVLWPVSSAVDTDSFLGKISAKTGLKFDIPTEAQWEYACRAGTTSKFNNGSNSAVKEMETKLKIGRNKDNGGIYEQHAVVGFYLPNAWGLYDMHGNVIEWCRDRWGALSYGTDPVGFSEGHPLETARIWRGGGWNNPEWYCTSFCRSKCRPHGKSGDVGFRLALYLSDK